METSEATSDVSIYRFSEGAFKPLTDRLVRETILNFYVDGRFFRSVTILDREVEELIKGQLFLDHRTDPLKIRSIKRKGTDCFITTHTSELTGSPLPPVKDIVFSAEQILSLVRAFTALPTLFEETGAVHTAALADRKIRFWAEDISRRHALEKLVGKALEAEASFPTSLLLLTCRVTGDILQKALKAGIPVVISLGAPTREAVDLADTEGITLCGFVRESRFSIYSHRERIQPG